MLFCKTLALLLDGCLPWSAPWCCWVSHMARLPSRARANALPSPCSEDPDDRPSAAQLLQRLNQFLERPKPAVGASHRAMEQ
jgi:hypothetical protein